MCRIDSVIQIVRVLVGFVSVFVLTIDVEASLELPSEGYSGMEVAEAAVLGPYTMYDFIVSNHYPLIFHSGEMRIYR